MDVWTKPDIKRSHVKAMAPFLYNSTRETISRVRLGGVPCDHRTCSEKPDLVSLRPCTVNHGALSNRSRERRDNVAHAWNISKRFYCDRVPLPDWYARVSEPKKFCGRVVCLTATLPRTQPSPAPALLASVGGSSDAASVKVGDAATPAILLRYPTHTRRNARIILCRPFAKVYCFSD